LAVRHLKLLYPLLFAVLRVLHTAATNDPAWYTLGDLFGVLGLLLAVSAVLYAALSLLLRGRWPAEAIALLFMAAVVGFWGYPFAFRHLVRANAALDAQSAHALLLVVGGTITFGALAWLRGRPRVLERLTAFFAMSGILLVGWSALQITRNEARNRRALQAYRGSALARELAKPIPLPAGPTSGARAQRRDIYLIVLDMYGSSATLREFHGFDNRAFEDSLRQMGFTIPATVRSNYSQTTLSLPSVLNFAHLVGLNGMLSTRVPHGLVARNRAVRLLKSEGYRFVFVPSQWWPATRESPEADVTLRLGEWSLSHDLTSSTFQALVLKNTVLDFTGPTGYDARARYVKRTFEGLRQIPGSAEQPTLVIAHVLSPHSPYVLDRTCGTQRPSGKRARRYIEQVQCVNGLVLGLVRELLARSRVPPIILLQGDHGPALLGSLRVPSLDRLSPDQLRERFEVFGAYYLPDGGGRLFADTMTMVNILPKVFNYYFGTTLPMQPDDMYFWNEESYGMWPVDQHLLYGRRHETLSRP
jgi:hypothetical protein